MNKALSQYKSSKDVITNQECIGCGACINICPYRKLNYDSAVIIFECTNEKGKCDFVCPKTKVSNQFNQTEKASPIGKVLKIYKSKAGTKFHDLFAEKKTVTALNCFILKSQISQKILMAKTQKDLKTIPFFAKTEDEIINFSQTNYCSSPMLEPVNLSKEPSYSFTGLPCQVLSLAKFETLDENFTKPYLPEIKISLFCTWSLIPSLYSKYLKNKFPGKKLIKSSISSPNEKKIYFEFSDHSKSEKNLEEIKHFIRNGCTSCTDLTGEFSDISVGDCETDPEFNTLIIRTSKGLDLVNNAVKNNYLEIFEYPEDTKIMLEKASVNKKDKTFKS